MKQLLGGKGLPYFRGRNRLERKRGWSRGPSRATLSYWPAVQRGLAGNGATIDCYKHKKILAEKDKNDLHLVHGTGKVCIMEV